MVVELRQQQLAAFIRPGVQIEGDGELAKGGLRGGVVSMPLEITAAVVIAGYQDAIGVGGVDLEGALDLWRASQRQHLQDFRVKGGILAVSSISRRRFLVSSSLWMGRPSATEAIPPARWGCCSKCSIRAAQHDWEIRLGITSTGAADPRKLDGSKIKCDSAFR